MAELVFYTNPMSRGRTVRWMLEELGEPYRTEIVEYGPEMRTPEFLALNPMGKLPILKHGSAVVTETAAICAYLADAFPQAGLAPPPADPGRGAYYRWLFFAAGPCEAGIMNQACGMTVPTDKEGMIGYGNLNRMMDGLEVAVSKTPYLAGECFSAADVYAGGQIGFGMMFGALEKRPAFEAYIHRLSERPAHKRATEIDDKLLAERAAREPVAG